MKSGRGRKGKGSEEEEEEPQGFKSGNVEVFSSDDSSDAPRRRDEKWQYAVEVEIIDAEMEDMEDDDDWRQEENVIKIPQQQPSSAERFSNAWKGGPKSAAPPASSTTFPVNGNSSEAASPVQLTADESNRASTSAFDKAQELLTNDPEIPAIVTRAQSNPNVQRYEVDKLREAVRQCEGDPTAFGQYWNDPVVGPILKELKECISSNTRAT